MHGYLAREMQDMPSKRIKVVEKLMTFSSELPSKMADLFAKNPTLPRPRAVGGLLISELPPTYRWPTLILARCVEQTDWGLIFASVTLKGASIVLGIGVRCWRSFVPPGMRKSTVTRRKVSTSSKVDPDPVCRAHRKKLDFRVPLCDFDCISRSEWRDVLTLAFSMFSD